MILWKRQKGSLAGQWNAVEEEEEERGQVAGIGLQPGGMETADKVARHCYC